MVNYACAFSQSELRKYFEWIITHFNLTLATTPGAVFITFLFFCLFRFLVCFSRSLHVHWILRHRLHLTYIISSILIEVTIVFLYRFLSIDSGNLYSSMIDINYYRLLSMIGLSINYICYYVISMTSPVFDQLVLSIFIDVVKKVNLFFISHCNCRGKR